MISLPIYDISFDPSVDLGMTAISFVDYPAICQDFVYMSKDSNNNYNPGQILMANAERREVVSPVLIPNQLILRIDENGEKYYCRWTKEVIEQVAQFYLMNQFSNNFTIMHEWMENGEGDYQNSFVKDVYMLRMWIIDDPKNDEANKVYGYHLPEGTLMVHLKIHNRKLWQRIKSGELKGLSIEAFLPMQENGKIKYNKPKKTDMNKSKLKDVFDSFMLWYNQVSEDAKDLADVANGDETESGEVSLKYYTSDTDYIEIATDGTATASDGTPVQDGEYPLNDGSILVIVDGKFSETKTVEESDEPQPVEAPIAEAQDDEEDKKEDEEQPVEEPAEDEQPEDKKEDEEDEQKQEEVDAPYTLVEVEVNGVVYNVPQEVADYIHALEDKSGMAESFRKELAKLQSVTPSVKPVGNVIKENKDEQKKENVADCFSLVSQLNRKLN